MRQLSSKIYLTLQYLELTFRDNKNLVFAKGHAKTLKEFKVFNFFPVFRQGYAVINTYKKDRR